MMPINTEVVGVVINMWNGHWKNVAQWIKCFGKKTRETFTPIHTMLLSSYEGKQQGVSVSLYTAKST